MEDRALGRLRAEFAHAITVENRSEVNIIVENLDVGTAAFTVEDNSNLDGLVSWALEVVAVAARDVSVESRLATGVSRVEDLENIEFTAAGFPAGAFGFAVLKGAWDGSVKDPGSGHIHVEAGLASQGHGEFQEEELARAIESIYRHAVSDTSKHCLEEGLLTISDSAWTDSTTRVTLAFFVGHDDDLLVIRNHGVLENAWGGRALKTVIGGIREGVSKHTKATVVNLTNGVYQDPDHDGLTSRKRQSLHHRCG